MKACCDVSSEDKLNNSSCSRSKKSNDRSGPVGARRKEAVSGSVLNDRRNWSKLYTYSAEAVYDKSLLFPPSPATLVLSSSMVDKTPWLIFSSLPQSHGSSIRSGDSLAGLLNFPLWTQQTLPKLSWRCPSAPSASFRQISIDLLCTLYSSIMHVVNYRGIPVLVAPLNVKSVCLMHGDLGTCC
jgi:hypothetical protein